MQDITRITRKLRSHSEAEELVLLGAAVVEPLAWTLQHDSSTPHRRYAAYALGRIQDQRAVEPLIQALRSDEPLVREDAAEALGHIGDARAVRPLLRALGDPTSLVRRSAEIALVKIGPPSVLPLIQELWDPRPSVHDSMMEALVKIGPPAVGPLMTAIKYANGSARQDAMTILERIGDARSVPRKVLADSRLTPRQKTETLEFLVPHYHLPDARYLCRQMLEEGDSGTRQGALEVLGELERRVLVRPCPEKGWEPGKDLLRPVRNTPANEPPEELLRANEEQQTGGDRHAKRQPSHRLIRFLHRAQRRGE